MQKLILEEVGFKVHLLNSTYTFLILSSDTSDFFANIIIESHDATFSENIFLIKNEISKQVNENSTFKLTPYQG